MANIPPIQIKRSAVSGNVPNPTTLEPGELSVNVADNKMFSSDGSNLVHVGKKSVADVADLLSLANVEKGEIYSVRDSKTMWMFNDSEWIVNEPDVDFADSSLALLAANFPAAALNGKFARVGDKTYKADTGSWIEQAGAAGGLIYEEYGNTGTLLAAGRSVGGLYYVTNNDSFYIQTAERLEPVDRTIREFSTTALNSRWPPTTYVGYKAYVLDSTTWQPVDMYIAQNGGWDVQTKKTDVNFDRAYSDWPGFNTNTTNAQPCFFAVTTSGNRRVGIPVAIGEQQGSPSGSSTNSFTNTYNFVNPIDNAAGRFTLTASHGALGGGYEVNRAWNTASDFWANSGTADVDLVLNWTVVGHPRRFQGANWDLAGNQRFTDLSLVITYDDATTETVQQITTTNNERWDMTFNAGIRGVTQIVMQFRGGVSGNPGGRDFEFSFYNFAYGFGSGLGYRDETGIFRVFN